jgi:hypothetical protein
VYYTSRTILFTLFPVNESEVIENDQHSGHFGRHRPSPLRRSHHCHQLWRYVIRRHRRCHPAQCRWSVPPAGEGCDASASRPDRRRNRQHRAQWRLQERGLRDRRSGRSPGRHHLQRSQSRLGCRLLLGDPADDSDGRYARRRGEVGRRSDRGDGRRHSPLPRRSPQDQPVQHPIRRLQRSGHREQAKGDAHGPLIVNSNQPPREVPRTSQLVGLFFFHCLVLIICSYLTFPFDFNYLNTI